MGQANLMRYKRMLEMIRKEFIRNASMPTFGDSSIDPITVSDYISSKLLYGYDSMCALIG